jgi:hypothetical protein
MGVPRNIIDLASRNGGCVSRSHLLDAGVDRGVIQRLLDSGAIESWQGDNYRVIPSRGWLDDIRSALLAIKGSVVSHECAGQVHEFSRVRRGLVVITAHSRTTHELAGVDVVRSHDVAPSHVTTVEGLRVTSIPRTIFDLSSRLHPNHLRAIIQDLVLERRLVLTDLRGVLDDVARPGKPGVRSFRMVLQQLDTAPIGASELERRGARLVDRAGVPTPEREYPIPWESGRRFDLAWPKQMAAIEWDSRRWHGALEQMTFDRRRDRAAIANGWVVMRFTWDDVTTRPFEVEREIRDFVRSRS